MIRYRLMLPILAVPFFAACTASAPQVAGTPCRPGNYDRKAPIICIVDTNLSSISADPDEAHVYEATIFHRRIVKWQTTSGSGDLKIDFNDPSTAPTEKPTCNAASGFCQAKVRRDARPDAPFKYTVTVSKDGQTGTKDPTIIIDTH